MESTIQALLASGKGILAADESFPTIGKRFKEFAIPSTGENHRDYREMLFTTPKLNEFISGVILFDETIRQKTRDDIPMPERLVKLGIIPVKLARAVVPSSTLIPGMMPSFTSRSGMGISSLVF